MATGTTSDKFLEMRDKKDTFFQKLKVNLSIIMVIKNIYLTQN